MNDLQKGQGNGLKISRLRINKDKKLTSLPFAFRIDCLRVGKAKLQSRRVHVFFTAAFDGQHVTIRLLIETGKDVRSVHEDRQSTSERQDGVDVEQETIKDQRNILPVINHLQTTYNAVKTQQNFNV